MSTLNDHFDRVCVINLPRSTQRRQRTESHLRQQGLATDIYWHAATNGHSLQAPSWWNAGPGAWGCLLSHSRVVEDALRDGVQRLLILEDDVIFHAHAPQLLDVFMSQVPPDWEQLFLGGQHLAPPSRVPGAQFVLKAGAITRAHAYALRGDCLARFHQHIWQAQDYMAGQNQWHFDTQFSNAHFTKKWRAYAPLWWLAGQDAGHSDHFLCENPAYWWQAPRHALMLPFVALRDASPPPEIARHVHLGSSVDLTAAGDAAHAIHTWLVDTARAALERHLLPAIPLSCVRRELVESLWPPGLVEDISPSRLAGLVNYPWHGEFPLAMGIDSNVRATLNSHF